MIFVTAGMKRVHHPFVSLTRGAENTENLNLSLRIIQVVILAQPVGSLEPHVEGLRARISELILGSQGLHIRPDSSEHPALLGILSDQKS
jgi:hypothetical protein